MMPNLLFAAATGETPVAAAIDFQTALLLVMVVCLAFMAKALADLSRRVSELTDSRDQPLPLAPSATSRPLAAAKDGSIAPELVAVITAAVYATLDQPVRIVAVDELTAAPSGTWSLEGRRQIFSSHRVR